MAGARLWVVSLLFSSNGPRLPVQIDGLGRRYGDSDEASVAGGGCPAARHNWPLQAAHARHVTRRPSH